MGNENSAQNVTKEPETPNTGQLASGLVKLLQKKLIDEHNKYSTEKINNKNEIYTIKINDKEYYDVWSLYIGIFRPGFTWFRIKKISTDGKSYILGGRSDFPKEFKKKELKYVIDTLKLGYTKYYLKKAAEKLHLIKPPETTVTPAPVRSLQGVSQNEGAPNGLLGDVATGTFEQISNAFGDVHTIGYGGSGATFLASLGAYEFLGLIGFLFFFALFVMKGVRACRRKKQRKAVERETFQKEVEEESGDSGGYEGREMDDMV